MKLFKTVDEKFAEIMNVLHLPKIDSVKNGG